MKTEGTICRITPEALEGAELRFQGKAFKIVRFVRFDPDAYVLDFELIGVERSAWNPLDVRNWKPLGGCSTPGDTRHLHSVTTCGHCGGLSCEVCAWTGVEIDGGNIPGMTLEDQQEWLSHNFPRKSR